MKKLSITYQAAYEKYLPIISAGWKPETLKTRSSLFTNKILPMFGSYNLSDITLELFNSGIDQIQTTGYITQKNRHEHTDSYTGSIRSVAASIIRKAAEDGLCEDIFWESEVELSPEQAEKVRTGLLIPKSLTPQQIMDAFSMLTGAYLEAGTNVGLLLMLTAGLRNNEACGLNYDNLRPIREGSDRYAIWILETTEKDSNVLKLGGKTANASRIIPLPNKVTSFLLARKAKLEERLNEDVSLLPIVCEKKNYKKRGTTNQLSAAAKELFKKINYDTVNLAIVDCMYRLDPKAFSEKNPTAYIFRRNYATLLVLLGFSETECELLIGHQIEDPYFSRRFFTNPDKLWEISERIQSFPLFNTVSTTETIALESETSHLNMSSLKEYEIPLSAGELSIRLSTAEPGTDLTLSVQNPGEQLEGSMHTFADDIPKSRVCNIRRDFFEAFSDTPKIGGKTA